MFANVFSFQKVLKEFNQSALRKTPLLFDQRIPVPSNTPELPAERVSPSPLLNRVRNVLIGGNLEPKPEGPLITRIKNILTEDPRDVPCTIIEQEDGSESSSPEQTSIGKDEDKVQVGVGSEELNSFQDKLKEQHLASINEDPKGQIPGDVAGTDVKGEIIQAQPEADDRDGHPCADEEWQLSHHEKSGDIVTHDSNDHKESYSAVGAELQVDKSDDRSCADKSNVENSEDLVSCSKREVERQLHEAVDITYAEDEPVLDDSVTRDSPQNEHGLSAEGHAGSNGAEGPQSPHNDEVDKTKDDVHEHADDIHDTRGAEERGLTLHNFVQDDLRTVTPINKMTEEPATKDVSDISDVESLSPEPCTATDDRDEYEYVEEKRDEVDNQKQDKMLCDVEESEGIERNKAAGDTSEQL